MTFGQWAYVWKKEFTYEPSPLLLLFKGLEIFKIKFGS